MRGGGEVGEERAVIISGAVKGDTPGTYPIVSYLGISTGEYFDHS